MLMSQVITAIIWPRADNVVLFEAEKCCEPDKHTTPVAIPRHQNRLFEAAVIFN